MWGGESGFVAREAERLARRAAEEEDLFTRVPMAKSERRRAAAAARKSVGMTSQVRSRLSPPLLQRCCPLKHHLLLRPTAFPLVSSI